MNSFKTFTRFTHGMREQITFFETDAEDVSEPLYRMEITVAQSTNLTKTEQGEAMASDG